VFLALLNLQSTAQPNPPTPQPPTGPRVTLNTKAAGGDVGVRVEADYTEWLDRDRVPPSEQQGELRSYNGARGAAAFRFVWVGLRGMRSVG